GESLFRHGPARPTGSLLLPTGPPNGHQRAGFLGGLAAAAGASTPGTAGSYTARVEDRTATRIDARPAPALRRYVSSYVGFDLRGFPAGVHCGPPSRVLTAVISLSGPLEVAAGVDDGSPVTRFDSVAGGLMRRSV